MSCLIINVYYGQLQKMHYFEYIFTATIYVTYNKCILYYLSITLSIYLSKKKFAAYHFHIYLMPHPPATWLHSVQFSHIFFFAKPLFTLVFVNWPVKEMLHSVRKYLLTYLECFLNQKMGKNSTMSTTSFENKILKSGKLGNFKKINFQFYLRHNNKDFLKNFLGLFEKVDLVPNEKKKKIVIIIRNFILFFSNWKARKLSTVQLSPKLDMFWQKTQK